MPFRYVAVGVLYADTYGLPDDQRTNIVRAGVTALTNFRATRIAAHPVRDVRWESPDSRPSMTFVAPEYMLAKAGNPPYADRLRTLAEKNTIEAEMKLLSSTVGAGLVLAPGSIAYFQDFANTPQALKEAQTQLGTGTEATKIALREHAAGIQSGGDLAQAERVRKWNPQKISLAGNTTPTIQAKRRALNSGAVQYIAKNEIALFHKGRDVARYAKICDFNEVSPTRAHTVFVPGAKIGRATVGGIPWGVEVCFDHNIGVLNNTGTTTAPRLHLICSASVARNEAKSVIQPGGYLIHSSSDAAECGVWRRNTAGAGFTATARLDLMSVSGGQAWLLCYEIELDLP
jgi:hypothetical protein